MTAFPPASELIPKCKITVQFNEDEASVPETDYLDGMFCLGLMEGILGTASIAHARNQDSPLFCTPELGIKTWIAAKAVVDFAIKRPELLEMDEATFSVMALADKYPCER